MEWLWTDDLARLLVERDGIDPCRVAGWEAAPTAYRAPPGHVDPLAFGRALLAVREGEEGAAA